MFTDVISHINRLFNDDSPTKPLTKPLIDKDEYNHRIRKVQKHVKLTEKEKEEMREFKL